MGNPVTARILDKDQDRKAILANYKASLMSDTKWSKVFAALRSVDPNLKVIVKFVGVDEPHRTALPHMHCPKAWADFFSFGPVPLRSIEWLAAPRVDVERRANGIPPARTAQPIEAIRAALHAVGRLPLEDAADEVRVIGHVPNGVSFPSETTAL